MEANQNMKVGYHCDQEIAGGPIRQTTNPVTDQIKYTIRNDGNQRLFQTSTTVQSTTKQKNPSNHQAQSEYVLANSQKVYNRPVVNTVSSTTSTSSTTILTSTISAATNSQSGKYKINL